MNYQLSPSLSRILIYSKEEAARLHNNAVGPGHLLLGLLKGNEGKAIEVIQHFPLQPGRLKSTVEAYLLEENLGTFSATNPETIIINADASRILKLSFLEARLFKSNIIDTEHLLLAMLRDESNIARRSLNENSISYENVAALLNLKPDIQSGFGIEDEEDESYSSSHPQGAKQSTTQTQAAKTATDTPVIDNFGVDVTKAAEENKLDPVVGRSKEIERIAQILSRRKKNNPVLIGEPGVGKSSIVEGLALLIAQKKVPRSLYNKRIVALDMASVVAGTKYRGQFEERIRNIILELQEHPEIILFIDEIHTIVGAGSAPGSMDAANMLKPALARGDLQCIGATTVDEYRKTIEKDGALERRFQKIMVAPTTAEETLQILSNIKEKYEEHHNVTYTDEALKACVYLTERYITDRAFPDKAIDVLDEAGSHVHLVNAAAPHEIEEQEKLIERLTTEKVDAARNQQYEQAARLRDRIVQEEETLERLNREWQAAASENRETVDKAQIEDVVSMMSGVPVQRMAEEESVRLRGMKAELSNKVIAQDAAIDKLVRAIIRSRIGLKDPNRPIGTFMFLGPTGVGKTHLAKCLADFMFGSPDALIRIDMSEYMEKYSVSRLVGAPPGYVGYDEGGQLTEKVRRHPYSIVLLDEIEKAHGDVFNLLLQVMDEGRLTDSNGVTVDFKNTIIILTSNCGTRQLKDFGRSIGFSSESDSATNVSMANSVIQKALHKQFAPEFINRLDEIIMFEPLTKEAIRHIADIELNALSGRIAKMGSTLRLTEAAMQFLVDKGYDVQYGARPLKRAIQTYVEDPLCDRMMETGAESGEWVLDKAPDADRLVFV